MYGKEMIGVCLPEFFHKWATNLLLPLQLRCRRILFQSQKPIPASRAKAGFPHCMTNKLPDAIACESGVITGVLEPFIYWSAISKASCSLFSGTRVVSRKWPVWKLCSSSSSEKLIPIQDTDTQPMGTGWCDTPQDLWYFINVPNAWYFACLEGD